MEAICMNTMNGAVTEYDGWLFQSITPAYAGNVNGLYTLGGDTDAGQPIAASFMSGKVLWDDSHKKMLDYVWFSIPVGTGSANLLVSGKAHTWSYTFPIRPAGESRGIPGKGIRENYLSFGFSNQNGAGFQIERMEVHIASSKSRRV